MEDNLLTTNEVIEILRISRITLYRWIKSEKIEFVRVGRKYLFSKNQIEKLFKNGK